MIENPLVKVACLTQVCIDLKINFIFSQIGNSKVVKKIKHLFLTPH
jgi:hypothetical protein